jgi:hypothetical protein
MYFGLNEVPTYLLDLMNMVFMEYLNKFFIVFINDILVFTKDEREYKEHLRLVLQKLRDHILYAKISECEFWMMKVYFLNHVISEEGMYVDPSRI